MATDTPVLTPADLGAILEHLRKFDVLHRVQEIGATGSIRMVPEEREDKVDVVKRKVRSGDGY